MFALRSFFSLARLLIYWLLHAGPIWDAMVWSLRISRIWRCLMAMWNHWSHPNWPWQWRASCIGNSRSLCFFVYGISENCNFFTVSLNEALYHVDSSLVRVYSSICEFQTCRLTLRSYTCIFWHFNYILPFVVVQVGVLVIRSAYVTILKMSERLAVFDWCFI